MKLAKISLATVVALGAFSSVASATPLEEAIKNVDLSGFARYRYDSEKTKTNDTKSNHQATHRFTSKLGFKAALDDNFFGVMGLRYNSRDGSGRTSKGTNTNTEDRTDVDSSFTVSEIYLGYKVGNTTITAGRQTLGTYFTDDLIGTGVKVLNSDVEGLTLAAVAFDDLEHGTNGWGLTSSLHSAFEEAEKEKYLKSIGKTEHDKLGDDQEKALKDKIAPVKNKIRQVVLSNNLYGVAAIGSYDPVSFQLWYASLTNIVNVIAADVSASFDVAKDVNMAVQAQYGHSDIDSELKSVLNDANLYTFQASSEFFGADAALGYVGWKVKNFATGLATLDDNGGFNDAGEQSFDYTALSGKGSFFYLVGGYTFDKVRLGADFVKGSIKDEDGDKNKYTELVGRADYKYSKKLKFSTWYSHLTEKETGGDKTKTSQFRFETKYSF